MQAILISALISLLPIVFNELGRLFVALFNKAKPLVEQAAQDKKLPSGEARHEFVVGSLQPELKASGSTMLDAINVGLVNVASKAAYEVLKKKLQ